MMVARILLIVAIAALSFLSASPVRTISATHPAVEAGQTPAGGACGAGAALRAVSGGPASFGTCGDDWCDILGETCESCPADCGACPNVCGNGILEIPEDCDDGNGSAGDGCSAGCLFETVCGNDACEGAEFCGNCPTDCGPCVCGNGLCAPTESCTTCPADCGDCVCGNGLCEPTETCSTCAADCGACEVCGDAACGFTEDCRICPGDCGPCVCGNTLCEPTESCSTCATDCGACPVCDDGICEWREGCGGPFFCETDCGACSPGCGDGRCSTSEQCWSCPVDCGPCPNVCGDQVVEPPDEECDDGNRDPGDGCALCLLTTPCGDGACEGAETCTNCPSDCGACLCGNGVCELTEACGTCIADCDICECGNGVCEAGEDCSICAADCGACDVCGDAVCGATETCASCDVDCGICVCGNTRCEPGETCGSPGYCQADCGPCPVCGDNLCDPREGCGAAFHCPADCGACAAGCGDGLCGATESCADCPLDCGSCTFTCGNGVMEPREGCDDGNRLSGDGCSGSCVLETPCGDAVCSGAESCNNCPSDCGPCPCGDMVCEAAESCFSCPSDCGPCPDSDMDGAGDPYDCDPGDPSVFAPPAVVEDVTLSGAGPTNLSFTTQAGTAGTGTRYDVVGVLLPPSPIVPPSPNSWACSVSGTTDAGIRLPAVQIGAGELVLYLVRARNTCGIAFYQTPLAETDELCLMCGNSVVEPPETCDDGNTDNGDGCSAICTVE